MNRVAVAVAILLAAVLLFLAFAPDAKSDPIPVDTAKDVTPA